MGVCKVGIILPINVPKCHIRKVHEFWQETSKLLRVLLSGTWFSPSHTNFLGGNKRLLQEEHSHSEILLELKCLGERKNVEYYLANEGSGLEFSSTNLAHIFRGTDSTEFGVMFKGKIPHLLEIAHNNVRIHSFLIYTDLIEYNIVG